MAVGERSVRVQGGPGLRAQEGRLAGGPGLFASGSPLLTVHRRLPGVPCVMEPQSAQW